METQAMIATALCFGVGLILVFQGLGTRGKRDQGSGAKLTENKPLKASASKQNVEGDTSKKKALARSSSYMDAINTAAGLFFAVKWDKEDAEIWFEPVDLEEPNRSEKHRLHM